MNPNRYNKAGALKQGDVCTLLSPKPIAESAKKLVAAIDVREAAHREHAAVRAEVDRFNTEDAYALRSGKTRDSVELAFRATAVKFDETSKAAAALSREHAAVVAEHAEAWAVSIESALGDRVGALGSGLASMLTDLAAAIDDLKSALHVARGTTPTMLERFKLRKFTHGARSGVEAIRQWVEPPVERRGFSGPVVVRNLGPPSRESAEFMGRSE